MALPLPTVVTLLLVQVGALLMGFLGPPGRRMRPALTILLLGAGPVLLPLGLGAVAIGESRTGTLMGWCGVMLFACAGRRLRAPGPACGWAGPPGHAGRRSPLRRGEGHDRRAKRP